MNKPQLKSVFHGAAKCVRLVETLESRTLLSAAPQVMGYQVDYKIGTNTAIHYQYLDEVNYFALLPSATPAYSGSPAGALTATSNGSLQPTTDSGYSPAEQLPALITRVHGANANAKIFVTIGAGDPAAIYDMDALVNTPSSWAAFATNVKNFCNTYGLAGVDLDWEPTAQAGFKVTKTQIENFGSLCASLKANLPGLKVTADALGDPVEISTPSGGDTGTSAYMLSATAITSLDAINVEAYPVSSESEANTIMQNWAAYVTGAAVAGGVVKDVDGMVPSGRKSQLQYGLDVAGDDVTNRPPGVVERKTDATIDNGYGGLFIFELDSDTPTPDDNSPALDRIHNEIASRIVTPAPTVVGVTPQDPAGSGGGQRSIVSQLLVTFSEPVALSAGAYSLGLVNNYGSGANNGSADTVVSQVLGTPTNPSNDGVTWLIPIVQSGGNTTYSYNLSAGGASLQDGVYRLTVNASAVTASGGGPSLAANYTSPMFHRLYGDTDGNKTVNALDFAKFKQTFGVSTGGTGYNNDLDSDGNGTVNALDYAQFKKRFGLTFTYT